MLVEDSKSHHGFWTRPRPWVLVLLLSASIANFILGPRAYFNAAVEYKDRGWTEASRIFLRMAEWANPWSEWGRKAEAYRKCKLPRHNISEAAQGRNIDAYNLDEMGNTEAAVTTFKQLINDCPDFEWPYNNLANIMLESGKLDEAKSLCQKALSINPDYANAHITLAMILAKQGEREAAESQLASARKLLNACGEDFVGAR